MDLKDSDMRLKIFYFILIINAQIIFSQDISGQFESLTQMALDPVNSLKKMGNLMSLGNSDLKDAQIVFLPEIHDDDKSLLVQLLVLANQTKVNPDLVVLDESLNSLKKSSWELFTQKSMEIVAAKDSQSNKESYVPKRFENKLLQISNKLQKNQGDLVYLDNLGIWSFHSFKNMAKSFYGWDVSEKISLTKRNQEMVKTLSKLENKQKTIFVMLGARHVPDLEFGTTKDFLCKKDQFSSKDEYFSYIKKRFGKYPNLSMGIGSTLPIYEYIKNKRYAVIFLDSFYDDLNQVMKAYHQKSNKNECLRI